MINKDRIVPATAQDLLGIYLVSINAVNILDNADPTPCIAGSGIGEFNAADFANMGFATEPIKKIIMGEATTADIIGVLDYDFDVDGISNAAGTHPAADGCTLYHVLIANGGITIRSLMTGEVWEGTLDAGGGK